MKSPIILRIFKNDKLLEVKQFELDQVIFGAESDVQVRLEDNQVAAIHCLIERRDSGYYVCDLGSVTGTFKNDLQILDESISSGDQIKVGPFTIHFFVGVPKPKGPPLEILPLTPPSTSIPKLPPKPPTPPATGAAKGAGKEAAKGTANVASNVTSAPSTPAAVVIPEIPPEIPKVPKKPVVALRAGVALRPDPPQLPETGKSESKPKAPKDIFKKEKHVKTFAPNSDVNLRESLRPDKGPNVEVIVAWKERVLETYHFEDITKVNIGNDSSSDIFIPTGFINGTTPFLEIAGTCRVTIPSAATAQLIGISNDLPAGFVTIQQGELLCVSFEGGLLQIFVRYTPEKKIPLAAPLLDLSSGELTGMVMSLVIVALTALYMSVYTPPPPDEKKEEDQVRLAQFIYNKPPPTPTPEKVKVETGQVVKDEPTPIPTPEKKHVVKVTEKKQEQTKIGKKESTAAATERPSTKAAEVRPMPSKVDRPKKFTSVKHGGSVKTGNTEGSNMQSAKDVTKTGLMAAFGGGGSREKLDQAYSGAGDVIGMANQATGKAGQKDNRSGDDLGSKFKDTGAGGKGTATSGIAGVGTKGRASGQSAYGGVGIGGKGSVAIDAGGSDAEFVGTIDREAVRRVVRSKLSEIKNCYERALNVDKTLEGKVVIRFTIEDQGRVRIAHTKSSTLRNRAVEECVATRLKNAIFPEPPPGTVAEVDYPFVFGSQN